MPEESSTLRNIAEHGRKAGFRWPDFTPQNVLMLVLLVAVVIGAFYIFKPEYFKGLKTGGAVQTKAAEPAKSSGYSAVFLVNGQVYFGKLADENGLFPKLREVFYLRVDRQLQPAPATAGAQPDISLVKLGNELHGPADEIKFNREQILYIEDLKADSRIVKAIEEFKSRK